MSESDSLDTNTMGDDSESTSASVVLPRGGKNAGSRHPMRKKDLALSLHAMAESNKNVETVKRKALADFMKEQSDSTTTPSGVIRKVRFFNFMCHDSFEKKWHPNMNFITGENGSGKSSILNGIIVGLGARAAVTSRSKSIKSLIKTGKTSAKIEITLGNEGALNPEKYGNEFTIQRIIDFNGVSNYKIIVHGKPRVLRRFELDSILLALGIQLDNPVSILNQETARSFLQSKDPRDKYKFFYSGTLLDKCESVIIETENHLAAASTHLDTQQKVLLVKKENLLKLERLIEEIMQIEKMTESVAKLEQELAWSLVLTAEKSKSQLEVKLQSLEGHFTVLSTKLTRSKEERDRVMENREEQAERLKIQKEIKENEVEIENIKKRLAVTKKIISEAEVGLRGAKSRIRVESKLIKEIQTTIDNLTCENEEIAQSAKREYDAKLLEFQTQKAKLAQELESMKSDSNQLRHGAESFKNEMHELITQNSHFMRQLTHKKEALELSKKSISNKCAPFGRQMMELVAKIQANAGRFSNMPRGPLGALFTVKSEKWLCIIEHVLGPHLFNFVVDNSQNDRNLLNQLIQQTYGTSRSTLGRGLRRPDVYMKQFESGPLDISRGNASMKDHPTILDVITIENDDFIVRNALIDFARVETVLLFDKSDTAAAELSNFDRPDFPVNCKLAYSLDFYKITPAPRLRVDPVHVSQIKKQAEFLKSSNVSQRKNLQADIKNLEEQINAIGPALEEKKREERRIREELETRVKSQKQLERKYQQVLLSIEQTKRTPYQAPDTSNYVEELEEKKIELARAEQQQEASEQTLGTRRTEESDLSSKKSLLEQNTQGLQGRLMKMEEESHQFQLRLQQIQNIVTNMEKELKELENKKTQVETMVQKSDEELQLKLDAATLISPLRIDTQRGSDTIQTEIKSLNRRVDESKGKTSEKEKITRDYTKAKHDFSEHATELEILHILFKTIYRLATAHREYFEKTRREIGIFLSGCFLGLLGARRYKGKLIIEHEKKELYYFVCADEEANANAIKVLETNNNKKIKSYMQDYAGQLSGGEASFSTICFIISMWQVMESPFFMLDEFDVFMDAFNRKSSQTALISHAQNYRSHQFFFFTPLDLSIQPDPKLSTILRLFPPVRDENVRPEDEQDAGHSLAQASSEEDETETPDWPSSKLTSKRIRLK